MRQFFSTILSQAYSRKKIILGGLAIALLVSFAPLQIAHAGFFDGLINVIIKGAAGLVDALVAPITLLVKFIAGLIGDVMYEAVKFFTNIPIVPPKAPDAIANGWNFTRNLVNIIFILILTFIGLATILRLQTYQLQKTLPSLIIIALLVNFSTVLVGFVVDIGNIFTNAFLGEAAGADWKNIGSFSFSGNNPAANLATHVAEIFYYLFAILIYFVIILLFAVRTIILWVLTILSPIAFGAFILPGTKKYWSQWLQQLIQWSILGIPISFSLLLAKNVLTSANFGTKLGLADGSAPAALMAPFTALVILFVGITLSMQMAPAGASGVINMGKKAGLKAGGWAAREGWRNIARGKAMEKLGANIRKRGQGLGVKLEDQTGLEKIIGGTIGKVPGSRFLGMALRKTGVAKVVGSGIELGSKELNARVKKRDEASIAQGEKDVGKDSAVALKNLREESIKPGLRDKSRMLGWFTQVIKNGDTDDITKAIDNGEINWDLVRDMYKNAKDNGNVEQSRLIEKAFLSRTFDKKDAQGNIIENSNELGVSTKDREKIFEKITGQDITSGVIGTESLDIATDSGQMVMDEIIKHRGADLMPQLLRNTNKEGRQKTSQYLNGKGVQWFVDNGAEDVLRYSLSSGAASLGINPIGGITPDQLTTISSLGNKPSQDLKAEITELETEKRTLEQRVAMALRPSTGITPEQREAAEKELQKLNEEKNRIEQRLQLPNRTGLTNVAGAPISAGITITQEEREAAEKELQKLNEEKNRIEQRLQLPDLTGLTNEERENAEIQLRRVKKDLEAHTREQTRRQGAQTAQATPTEIRQTVGPQVGDSVHWVSQGVQQTISPVKVLRIEPGPDGKQYAFIEGTNTGVPVDQLEIQGRRSGAQMGQAAPAPEQPLSVQIARLKEQEEQLKQIAGTPRTIRGVEIPMTRKGGISYLPGEKARAELRKVQTQRTKLEQQLAQKEGDMQAIENLISGADSGIKQEQEAIGVIQSGIDNLVRKEQNGETILQRSREEQAKDPSIIPQALIEQQEESLRETKSRRVSLEEALQEHRTKLNTHQGRKKTLMEGWQTLSKLEQPVKDMGTLLTENFTKAEGTEQEAQKKLSALITQRAMPNEVAKAREVLQKARATREGWGSDLGRFQRLQELKQELATAQGVQDQRKKNLESLEKGVESMEQEIDLLTTQRNQTNAILATLENSLEADSQDIAKKILGANPDVGASSQRFKKTLREKLGKSEAVQQQITKIDQTEKQQQDQLRVMKERAAYRVLRDNPSLGMGSHAFQQEAEQRISQDPEVQQRTALLQRAEERLAEARKQLEALPEAMRVSPPPEILQTVETSQRRITEIQRDIQSSKDRALKQLVRRERELTKTALDSPDLQKTVEGLPEIQQSSKEMQQQLNRLINALPKIRENEQSRLYTEDPDLQEIKRSSEEMRKRVQESSEMKALRSTIQKRRQELKETKSNLSHSTRQQQRQEEDMGKARLATESAQETTRKIEEEQETVDRGDKIIKPKVERKKAPKK